MELHQAPEALQLQKVLVHCYLHFAGVKNNSCNKTYLQAFLHLPPNNMGCRTSGKDFWKE